MMHVLTGLWKSHILRLLQGKRHPSGVKQRKKNTPEEQLQVRRGELTEAAAAKLLKERNAKLKEDHARCGRLVKSWTVSKETGQKMDQRSLALAGETRWIRSNLEVYSHLSNLTSHDILNLILYAGDYLLADVLADHPKYMDTLFSLVEVCRACVQLSCTWDSTKAAVNELKTRVLEALCKCEAFLPPTELAVMFHVLSHVPDCIYRWNNVRNFWCFFGERAMGTYIRFINNRDLAAESIRNAVVRQRVVLDCFPGASANLLGATSPSSISPPPKKLVVAILMSTFPICQCFLFIVIIFYYCRPLLYCTAVFP